jgi:hypothetical protein
MEEPTHSRESQFWDQVADWLLCVHDAKANVLSWEEIAGIARAAHASDANSASHE